VLYLEEKRIDFETATWNNLIYFFNKMNFFKNLKNKKMKGVGGS